MVASRRTLVSVPLTFLASTRFVAAQAPFPLFVGRDTCLQCHIGRATTGDPSQPGDAPRFTSAPPCTLEPIPRHDQSYESLLKAEALSIAAISGVVEQPVESRICLDCHATGADEGARWTERPFRVEDGVQCEACHGAGSLHADAQRVTVDARRDQGSANRRAAAGFLIRRGDRDGCKPCHVERPSHQEVLDRGFRLSPADFLYKTPVNLAVSPDGDRLYAACERSDSMIVLRTDDGTLLGEVPVGRRPQDVAVSPDGRQVYVTNRMSGTLSVIDAERLALTAQTHVGAEPHGVVTDRSGRRIFVLNTAQDSLSILDAESLIEVRRLAMGGGPWSLACELNGVRCAVTSVRPSSTPFRDPTRSEISIVDLSRAVVASRAVVPDANMLQGIAWVPGTNVVLFTLVRTKNLIPTTRIAQGWVITNGLGVVWPDGRIDQVLLDEPNNALPDPMDIAASPDGRFALITSGGKDEVALVDVSSLLRAITSRSDAERESVLPNHLGTSEEFVVKRIAVGRNPRGVAYSPDGRSAYVANALDDTVSILDTSDYRVSRTVPLGGAKEITQLRTGERLFHSAAGTYAWQFSCRSCHPDGHINGLSFDIEADGIGLHPVDNRTLRGILDTAPFKWAGTNPSLHRQCGARLAVFFTRLDPFPPKDLDALVRYMSTIEQPPNRFRDRDGLTHPQRRGKAIFERAERNDGTPIPPAHRCTGCHNGAYLTNRQRVGVATTMWFDAEVDVELSDLSAAAEFGELGSYFFIDTGMPSPLFDVPHLRNIVDGAPYLHNGAAATLEEIWTRFNMVDRHGATADLTRQQLNDLIAYLKSL